MVLLVLLRVQGAVHGKAAVAAGDAAEAEVCDRYTINYTMQKPGHLLYNIIVAHIPLRGENR